MAIGSQVFAAGKDSPAAQKRVIPPGEFLLTIIVVMAASMLGVLGGIWLAERDRSTGRQSAASPHASSPSVVQPPNTSSKPRTTDLSTAPVSITTAREPESERILLGLPSVRAFTRSQRSDHTEIAIELRAAELLHAAQLHNPERVYFDLADSGQARRPKGRLKSHREVSVRDDRVARVRVVRWQSGAVRLVVDLRRPCQYSYRLNPGPSSLLVIKLWAHPSDTLASQKPREGATSISEAIAAERP